MNRKHSPRPISASSKKWIFVQASFANTTTSRTRMRRYSIQFSSCLLGIMMLTAQQTTAQTVTAFITDSQLQGVRGITTDGINFYVVSTPAPGPGGKILSVPVGGGSLTELHTYFGSSSTGSTNPADITLVGSDLYWIDSQSGPITDSQILKGAKDGSGSVTAIYTGASVGQPIVDGTGITTDGIKLYTADSVQGRIHSLNPDGTGITQLASRYGGFFDRDHFNGLVWDSGTLYIADAGLAGFPDTPPRVQSISASGGVVTTLYQGSLPGFSPTGIEVVDDTIYLTNNNQEILLMPKTGGTPTLFASDPGFSSLWDLVHLNGALYVADRDANTIWKVDIGPPNSDPIANAGPDQEIECTNPNGELVTLDGTGSSDPDGDSISYQWSVPASILLDDPTSATPTGLFPIGITLATLTVTDGKGGVDVDDVQITVVDTIPPEVACTTDVMALWPPNHNMQNVQVFVDATDNCTNPENLILLSVTASSSEPDDAQGNGDGSTTGDVNGSDGFTAPVDVTSSFAYNASTASFEGNVSLRAERAGSGSGRTYTFTADVLDNLGNLAQASCVVVVPQNKSGK